METETHPDLFFVLPTVAVTQGQCSDPQCGTTHWRLSLGWFIWSVHFVA